MEPTVFMSYDEKSLWMATYVTMLPIHRVAYAKVNVYDQHRYLLPGDSAARDADEAVAQFRRRQP